MWLLHCSRYKRVKQKIISPVRPAPPWTWVTGSPFPLWSLLGSAICEYSDSAWKICALSESLRPALCRELPSSYSPSHPVQPWTAGLRQRGWRGEMGDSIYRPFLQLGAPGMLEEMLRAVRVPTQWKVGALGDMLQSTRGRWHLCRMNSWQLHTRYTEKAHKLTVTGKWSMPKLWMATLAPVSPPPQKPAQAFEVLRSSSLLLHLHLPSWIMETPLPCWLGSSWWLPGWAEGPHIGNTQPSKTPARLSIFTPTFTPCYSEITKCFDRKINQQWQKSWLRKGMQKEGRRPSSEQGYR